MMPSCVETGFSFTTSKYKSIGFYRNIDSWILHIYQDILGNIDGDFGKKINKMKIDQTHKNVGKNSKNKINNKTHIEVVLWKKLIYV